MIHIGSDSDFRLVGDFLRLHYTEAMLTAELGVGSIFDFTKREPGRPLRNTLAQLFFGGAQVAESDLRKAIPESVMNALIALGLIARKDEGKYVSDVLLYPVHSILIASDRLATPDGIQDLKQAPQDFVYLAITERTRSFLSMLPNRECDAFLDIGAGSGVAAILASRDAKQCWATDISDRSALFAEFNARLNDASNLKSVVGSLYDPVAGLTFDRIVTHPPYDLTLSGSWSFCDGGSDGEFVLRGAIEGLSRHLRPGGQFYAQARAGDRKGKPLEQRIREWLGDDHQEFDLAIIVRDIVQPEEYAFASVMSLSKSLEDYETFIERFKQIEFEQLAYCNILIERRASSAEPLTLRRTLGERATSSELEWLIRTQRALPGIILEGCRPLMSPDMQLHVRHAFESGELRPVEYEIETTAPFKEQVPCPTWIARLVAACNGKHTTEEIYSQIKKIGPIQPHEFEAAMKRLIGIGAIERGAQSTGAQSAGARGA